MTKEEDNNRAFDLTGERFGKLTVVSFDRYENGASWWLCRCDCGGEKVVSRKQLRAGKTNSCGCLKGGHRAHGPMRRVELTDRQRGWILQHFKHTTNDEICEKMGISATYLHRFAREHGLTKTHQFRAKMQANATVKAKESHLRNHTYPRKGYVIPRSEEFQFRPGHVEDEKTKRVRVAKSTETMRKTRKLERARISFGIEQKTKLRLVRQNKNVVSLRYNLRKKGYIIETGSMVAYYDENTRRSMEIENRKFGDRNYVAFTFIPINNG